jgi:hypothetical protein
MVMVPSVSRLIAHSIRGLEGDIQQALTYYEDPLSLFKKCDYVMANQSDREVLEIAQTKIFSKAEPVTMPFSRW